MTCYPQTPSESPQDLKMAPSQWRPSTGPRGASLERQETNKTKPATQQAAFVRRGPKNKQTRRGPNLPATRHSRGYPRGPRYGLKLASVNIAEPPKRLKVFRDEAARRRPQIKIDSFDPPRHRLEALCYFPTPSTPFLPCPLYPARLRHFLWGLPPAQSPEPSTTCTLKPIPQKHSRT